MLDAHFHTLSESMKALQESMKELQATNKRMLSSICHVRSLLHEEMQIDSMFTDIPEISDATPITSVLESAYNDSNTEVADMVKSHLDSQLTVRAVGYTTVPKNISPFVLFRASFDTIKLELSPLSYSSKGPILPVKGYGHKRDMKFDCKVFDLMPNRDIFVEFHGPSTAIGSRPLSFGLHDCKWVDTGQVSDSFDIRQYYQLKLVHTKFPIGRILVVICCYLANWIDTGQELSDDSGYAPLWIAPLSFSSDAHKLFVKIAKRSSCVAMSYDSEYIGEVELFIECSDNLISFCNSFNLQSKSLETSLLYSLDGAVTFIVDTYQIYQLRSLAVHSKKIIDALHLRSASAYVARRMADALAAVNLSHHNKNMCVSTLRIFCHYDPLTDAPSTSCPLSDSLAGATILSLLIELHASDQVELGLYFLLPFDFECKIGIFARPRNLELVICTPARILEWTGCVDYLEGWTLLSPQLQEAEGILTPAGQIEGLSISFVGTPGSSHLVPAVHDFLHKEPYVAANIEQHTLEKLTNYPLQFHNSSRHALAAICSAMHQRAILLYYKVQHIQGFHNSVSPQLSEELLLTKLNAFLNESHQYDSILYACYCTESEEQIWIFHDTELLQKVLLQYMDDVLWVVQQSNISELKYQLYIKRIYGFMLDTVLGVIDAVGIASHGLEKEGTNVQLGHGALSFLQILPSTAPKVDIVDIGSMYFILVNVVKLLSKSLCFDIITWLLCLGRLIWACLKIGCMAMHLNALVAFTELIACPYSEWAFQLTAKMALTLASITVAGDVFYMEANSGPVTRV